MTQITLVPMLGKPGTIEGFWTLVHGNSEVYQTVTRELTREELETYVVIHNDLVNIMLRHREGLSLEDYCAKLHEKHGFDEQELAALLDHVIRSDAVLREPIAVLHSFNAIQYDGTGVPYRVMFDGSELLT